ncbi:hypothetical protein Bbelb_418850 [Branchiostoma belcheri]|nr:hypothetical protein Bbelb_418850 [Branchiostoma belcheri]
MADIRELTIQRSPYVSYSPVSSTTCADTFKLLSIYQTHVSRRAVETCRAATGSRATRLVTADLIFDQFLNPLSHGRPPGLAALLSTVCRKELHLSSIQRRLRRISYQPHTVARLSQNTDIRRYGSGSPGRPGTATHAFWKPALMTGVRHSDGQDYPMFSYSHKRGLHKHTHKSLRLEGPKKADPTISSSGKMGAIWAL